MSDQIQKKQGRKKTPELVDVERLRNLINTKKSRQEIADAIGCDVSTITKHYNGNNPVDIEWLYKYAKYFNVSTDYLLGLSESPFSNKDEAYIQNSTGLSAKSVKTLLSLPRVEQSICNYDYFRRLIDIILEEISSDDEIIFSFENLIGNTTVIVDMMYEYVYSMEDKTTLTEDEYGRHEEVIDNASKFIKGELYDLSLLMDKSLRRLSLVDTEQFSIDDFDNIKRRYHKCRKDRYNAESLEIKNNAEES